MSEGSRPTAPEPDDRPPSGSSDAVTGQDLDEAIEYAFGGSRTAPEPSEAAIEAAREASRRPDDIGESFLPRRLVLTVLRAAYAVDALTGPPPAGDPTEKETELLEVADQLVYEIEDEARRWPSSMAEFRHFALPKLATLQRKLGDLRAALRGGSPNEPCRACGERDAGIAPTAVHTCRGGSHQPEETK